VKDGLTLVGIGASILRSRRSTRKNQHNESAPDKKVICGTVSTNIRAHGVSFQHIYRQITEYPSAPVLKKQQFTG
jgi:hypothetical protein